MQIPTIAEQTLTQLSLLCEIWGFGANGNFLFALLSFVATLILAVTIRVGATIRIKNNSFLLGAVEEAAATITVGATFFF